MNKRSASRGARSARVALLLLAGASLTHAQKAYVTNSSAPSVSVIDTLTNTVVATASVGTTPSRVVIAPAGGRAFVANTGSDSLSILSTATDAVVATISVGDAPSSLAVSADGARVYVGCASGQISVVDTGLGVVVSTISAGASGGGSSSVNGLALSLSGTKLYALWGNLVVIDTAAQAIVNSVYVGNYPMSLALTADGARIYVPICYGLGNFSFYGSVTVFATSSASVTGSIFTWAQPNSIAITPDGARALLTTPYNFVNTGYGAGFLPTPWLQGLDLTHGSLGQGINLGAPGSGVALSPDGSRAYAAVPSGNRVAVIDTATNTILTTVSVGAGPTGIAVAPAKAKNKTWTPTSKRP